MALSGDLRTAIARTDLHRIEVRGRDLCQELLGRTGFTEYFLFLLTGQRPSDVLLRMTDAALVAIAEHGLVPSVVAARMTLAAAPDALQGAVSAGLLGCGSVILGASETAGQLLVGVMERAQTQNLGEAAREVLTELRVVRQPLPGFGHSVHREGDPRATKLLTLATEWGVAANHVGALRAVQAAVPAVWGRELVLNVSGVAPALAERLAQVLLELRTDGLTILVTASEGAHLHGLCDGRYEMERGTLRSAAQGEVAHGQ